MLIQNIEYFFIVLINGLNVLLYYSVQEDKITGIERREKGTGGGGGRGGALHLSTSPPNLHLGRVMRQWAVGGGGAGAGAGLQ